jgi:hypothetical protein
MRVHIRTDACKQPVMVEDERIEEADLLQTEVRVVAVRKPGRVRWEQPLT